MATLNICSAWAESLGVGPTRAGQRGLLALAVAFGGSLGAAENRGVTRAEATAVCAGTLRCLALAHTPTARPPDTCEDKFTGMETDAATLNAEPVENV